MSLRISGLTSLGCCPGFHLLQKKDYGPVHQSALAGTLVGEAIERWHKGIALDICVGKLDEQVPKAYKAMARKCVRGYAADKRNQPGNTEQYGEVIPELMEKEVKLELPPSPDDPIQWPIQLIGHVDQIRRARDGLYVWDLKTGTDGGVNLLYKHAWQLAGYALAASETLGEPVKVGGIIRGRDYAAKDATNPIVFYEGMWGPDQCRMMLDTVRQHIAWLHQGYVHLHPGAHCGYCPGGNPATCDKEIERLYS